VRIRKFISRSSGSQRHRGFPGRDDFEGDFLVPVTLPDCGHPAESDVLADRIADCARLGIEAGLLLQLVALAVLRNHQLELAGKKPGPAQLEVGKQRSVLRPIIAEIELAGLDHRVEHLERGEQLDPGL
jgi:hypothetical protein